MPDSKVCEPLLTGGGALSASEPLREDGRLYDPNSLVPVCGDDGASVLDCEDASSNRPPTSQNETVRCRRGEAGAAIVSDTLVAGEGGSIAVLTSDSSLSRLISSSLAFGK